MKHLIPEILRERNLANENFSTDKLYQVGIEAVKSGIEFYYDKSFTCESVIKELFIRGIIEYIQTKKTI